MTTSRDRSGFIEKKELRGLFETLSREPARRRARAKAKAELAEEKLRQQVRFLRGCVCFGCHKPKACPSPARVEQL